MNAPFSFCSAVVMKRMLMLPSLALLLLAMPTITQAASWGPWSVSPEAPALRTRADRPARTGEEREQAVPSAAAAPLLWSLAFWQRVISPVDGGRCVMHPTCSQYGVLAVRKHGPVVGAVMTVDRLIHEADEQREAFLISVGNRYRYEDPVSNNDFWWYAE